MGRLWGVWIVALLLATIGCSSGGFEGGGGRGGEPTEAESNVSADNEALETLRDFHEVEAVAFPPNAMTCTMNSQCASGFCVDGFCCDNGCANKCMACSAAKKGGGLDGICGSVAANTDPDNDCPSGECDGKNMCKKYNGVACTAASECLSKYCVDGFCCGNICMGSCQACSAAKKGSGSDGVCGSIKSATDPDNECNPGECNGSGACTSNPQPTSPNGTPCTAATQCQSGYCADGVCCDSWCLGTCQACSAAKKKQGVDGTCGYVAYDQDPEDECWGGGCNGSGVCKQYNGVPCSDKSQCLSNYCVDGFCCGNICTQMCYACSEAKKGQGFDGVCGPIAAGKDVENECNPGECNGSGTCNQPQTPQANGTTCVSGGQCASGNCVDGVCCDTTCTGTCLACTTAKKGSGANGICGPIASETNPDSECNGGKCDGTGGCRYYNGATCSASNQCFSNYCVDGFCCGNACTGSCYACSAAKKGSGQDGVCGTIGATRDPDNECNPGECNGSGACNQPQSMQPNGATCVLATQCASGFCVEGMCCDTACTGTCKACTATKKGSGTNGTCGNIKYNTDPDNECASGSCSGSGTCQSFNGVTCANASECLSNYCVDGVCCGNVCNTPCMACTIAKRGGGFDGQCGPVASNTDPDNECFLQCNGAGGCQKTPNGVACTGAADCISGFCVDGTCCDSACTGTCQACSAAKKGTGTDGMCGPIATNTDPDSECPLGKCNGAGVCTVLLANGAACGTNDQCASEHCVDGVCCDTVCTGFCVACNVAGSVGTCKPIPLGQSEPNGTPPCHNVCDGNGSCVKNNGSACITGNECVGRVCNRLVCESAPAGQDLLVWRTIWELPPYWAGPYPTLNLKNIVATDSGTTYLNGDTSDIDQTPCVLEGYFSSTGVPQPSKWNGSWGTYNSFWEKLYKAGSTAGWASYQKVSLFGCNGNWGDGYSTAIAGNRAGRLVHIAQTCDTWGNGTNFGDGTFQFGPVLVRQMASGPNQVTGVPTNIAEPMAYGPSSEVYSIGLGGGLSIYKSVAGGGATTTKSIPGNVGSRGFDVDAAGNLLVAFSFSGSVNFGAGSMTAAGTDLGLVKLDANGNVVWQKRYGASLWEVTRVVAGEQGFGIVGAGSVNLGVGTTAGNFVARFDTSGNALWFANPSGYRDTNNSGAAFGAWSAMIEDNGSGMPLSQKFVLAVEKYKKCTGGAKCKLESIACTSNDDCGSGFCVDGVCCNSDCTSACNACSAAKKGSGIDGVCGAIAAGTDPDNECPAGACGVWGCALDNGQACASSDKCVSGNCVDGFCCNESCGGPCRACSAALSGGVNGICGYLAAGIDPQAECAGGTCNGLGGCSMAGNGAKCLNGSECLSTFCVDDVCCDAACSGECQACVAWKKQGGVNGVCGPIAIHSDPDNECTDGNCNGANACIHWQGSACVSDAACYSGHCVDGVCCDQACDGTCMACIQSKTGASNGYCRYAANGTDPDAECGGQTCNGNGQCWQVNGGSCGAAGECLSGYCVDGVCCDSVCTGRCQACTAAKTGLASDGVCGSIPAGADPDDECIGSTCDASNACAPISCNMSSDCPTAQCTGGVCTGILQLALGANHSCALFLGGKVKCWGYGTALGLGTTNDRGDGPGEMGANLPFVDLGTGRFAKNIAAGAGHTCVLFHGGSVACWGSNSVGQLGRGDSASSVGSSPGTMGDNLVLVNLGTGRSALDIAAGEAHTCVLLDNGGVKCWGYNYNGQLGIGSTVDHGRWPGEMGDGLPQVDLGTGRTAIAVEAGYNTTCVLLDNSTVKCWGNNNWGQLGIGDTLPRGSGPLGDNLAPIDLGTGKTVLELAMTHAHVCARLNDNNLKCWGSNSYGQLGLGDTLSRGSQPGQMGDNLPTINLGTGKTATLISPGDSFSCARLNDDNTKCWGRNDYGESGAGVVNVLGDGPGEMGDALVPIRLGLGKTLLRIASGRWHSCALLTDGSVKCWGYNNRGQLGLGDVLNRGASANDMGDNLPVVQLQ